MLDENRFLDTFRGHNIRPRGAVLYGTVFFMKLKLLNRFIVSKD